MIITIMTILTTSGWSDTNSIDNGNDNNNDNNNDDDDDDDDDESINDNVSIDGEDDDGDDDDDNRYQAVQKVLAKGNINAITRNVPEYSFFSQYIWYVNISARVPGWRTYMSQD